MFLQWKDCMEGTPITEKNAKEYDRAEASFGIFTVVVAPDYKYKKRKDGTQRYYATVIYDKHPVRWSTSNIPLFDDVQCTLKAAIRRAEAIMFGNAVYGFEEYRLPAESASIVTRVNANGGTL